MHLPIPDRTVFDDLGIEPAAVSPCEPMTAEQMTQELAALRLQLACLETRIEAYERSIRSGQRSGGCSSGDGERDRSGAG
jgi:hypothetical protein